MAIKNWLLKQQRKNDIEEGMSTGFRHRAAYHREFRGYSEIRTPTDSGRYKIERVYIAPWYMHDISDLKWVIIKISFALLMAAVIALFLSAVLMNTIWNYSKITGGLECLCAIALIVLLVRIIILIAAPRKMTAGQCDSIDRPLKKWLLIASICIFLASVWNFIFLSVFLKFQDFYHESVTFWLLLLAAIILLALRLLTAKIGFRSIENDNSIDKNLESYVIK